MSYRYYYFASLDEAHDATNVFEQYAGKTVDEMDDAFYWMYLNDPVPTDEASGTICVRLEIKADYTGNGKNRVGAADFNYLNFPEDEESEVKTIVEDKVAIPWKAIGIGAAIFMAGVIFGKRSSPVRLNARNAKCLKNPYFGPFSKDEKMVAERVLDTLMHNMVENDMIFAIDPKLRRKRR